MLREKSKRVRGKYDDMRMKEREYDGSIFALLGFFVSCELPALSGTTLRLALPSPGYICHSAFTAGVFSLYYHGSGQR